MTVHVPLTLVVSFGVVMHDELRQRASEVALAQDDNAIQALFFNRANEPLGVGPGWRPNDPNALPFQELHDCPTPLGIAVADQHAQGLRGRRSRP